MKGERHRQNNELRKLSLKQKFLLAAVVATLAGVAAIGAALWYQMHSDSGIVTGIASRESRVQINRELDARAETLARHVAESAAPALLRRDAAALTADLQPFLDDSSVLEIEVRDVEGNAQFNWTRAAAAEEASMISRRELAARVLVESVPGARTPRTVGTVAVAVRSVAVPVGAGSGAGELEAARQQQIQVIGYMIGALALLSLAVSGGLAWWAGRRLAEPLATLARGAERMGQGDYTRPLDVIRNDEIGDLQSALERMRLSCARPPSPRTT